MHPFLKRELGREQPPGDGPSGKSLDALLCPCSVSSLDGAAQPGQGGVLPAGQERAARGALANRQHHPELARGFC